MATDFERALGVLEAQDGVISPEVAANLSGASRAESKLFVALLDRVSPERRHEIMLRLAAYADESFELDFMALFRGSLMHGDPNVRRCAIEGLWEDERPSLADALVRILAQDPDASVRAAAATALGRFVFLGECDDLDERRSEAVRVSLERVIADADEDISVARRAIESIAFINSDLVHAIIERAYAHSEAAMRESAVFAMGRSADPCWADLIMEELDSGSMAMRYEAIRACGELELKRATRQILSFAEGPDRELQIMALWALGQIGGKRALEMLERWAESDDVELAAIADEAMSELELGAENLDLMFADPERSDYREFDRDDPDDDEDDEDLFDEDDLDELDEDESDSDDEWPDDFLEIG